jgi:ABC-type nitrate/sulfonate/bicarbonate transport system permease component
MSSTGATASSRDGGDREVTGARAAGVRQTRWTPLISLGGWIVAWWVAVAFTGVSSDFLPSPWKVAQTTVWLAQAGNAIGDGTLWVHAGWSGLRFLSGFALAVIVGVPLGMVMGRSRFISDLLDPLLSAARNVPPIAWAPFALLWFGAGFGSQMFVIFMAALPPILMNAERGIRLVDARLIDAARMLGATRTEMLIQVALPAAMPMVVAGTRIGVTNGWLALIGAEIVAGPGALTGLGFLVLVGQQNLQAAFSISAMVVIGLMGTVIDRAMAQLGQRLSGQ